MSSRMHNMLRGHAHFFCIIIPLILVMTYPTINHVFDASRFWVPAQTWDVWLKFWDAWHFKQVLMGNSNFYYTHLSYYPEGVSLVYLTYNLPHMIVMNLLQLVMPPSNAYCLTFLLIIFCCCASGYLYCNWLFKDKWLALLGAVIFGLSQQVTGTPAQPDLGFIATLPLTLYFLHRGIEESKAKLLAMAGIMLGATAWFGMYIFVCAALGALLFVLFFARSRWTSWSLWRGLALMGALAFVVSAGRTLPILLERAELDRVIHTRGVDYKSSDVLGYALSHRHPILYRLQRAVAGVEAEPLRPDSMDHVHDEVLITYMGLSTFALIGFGLLLKSSRKQMLPWLMMAAFFMILRLGNALKINGVVYEHILLPKHFLDEMLPVVFALFHRPEQFHTGALLPVAVLACYGLRALLDKISQRRRVIVLLALAALIAFETYFLPYAGTVDRQTIEYIDWLAAQEDQDSIKLIVLPTQLIYYGTDFILTLHQALHEYPVVAGTVSRLPAAAFSYIDANPVLAAGRKTRGISCSRTRHSEMSDALDQLAADGFTHIVLHKWYLAAAPLMASFADITPAFDNRYNSVYTLSQLSEHCADPPPGTDTLGLYLELVYGEVMPPRDEAVVTFHASERVSDEALRYLSWNNDFGKKLNHVTFDGAGTLSLQSTNRGIQNIDNIAARDAILFLHDPADAVQDAAWTDWLTSRFKFCGRVAESEHIDIDHYLRRDMPCALVLDDTPLHLSYHNGSQLLNRAIEVDGDDLRIALRWRLADGAKTSYSIQVFDAAGERLRQIDHVMNRAMVSHTIDVSALPAGEYSARLVVYDFETGASYSGVAADGARFKREMEIGRFGLGA